MSGPEEVDRLMTIVVDGCRAKMMRPKCLARPSWTLDSTLSLLNRVREEKIELTRAERVLRAKLDSDATGTVLPMEIYTVPTEDFVRAVAAETFDLANFGAMLVDPQRIARAVA